MSKLNLQETVCEDCDGTGEILSYVDEDEHLFTGECPVCSGTGYIYYSED